MSQGIEVLFIINQRPTVVKDNVLEHKDRLVARVRPSQLTKQSYRLRKQRDDRRNTRAVQRALDVANKRANNRSRRQKAIAKHSKPYEGQNQAILQKERNHQREILAGYGFELIYSTKK